MSTANETKLEEAQIRLITLRALYRAALVVAHTGPVALRVALRTSEKLEHAQRDVAAWQAFVNEEGRVAAVEDRKRAEQAEIDASPALSDDERRAIRRIHDDIMSEHGRKQQLSHKPVPIEYPFLVTDETKMGVERAFEACRTVDGSFVHATLRGRDAYMARKILTAMIGSLTRKAARAA